MKLKNSLPFVLAALAMPSWAQVAYPTAAPTAAFALGPNDVAIGIVSEARHSSVAIGSSAEADFKGTAIGMAADAKNDSSVAVGPVYSTPLRGVIVGVGSSDGNNSVAIGNATYTSRRDTVTFGSSASGNYRAISDVAAGTEATDAVNLGQVQTIFANATNGPSQAEFNALSARVNGIGNEIDNLKKVVLAGIASAAALAQPVVITRPGVASYTVGAATYGGQHALGIGVRYVESREGWFSKGLQKLSGSRPGSVIYGAGLSTNSARDTRISLDISIQFD